MPKLIVSIDAVVIKEVQLTQERTTLGRRPYNDVVIDNLAVSGEHAVIQMGADGVWLEDLDSTNGTYVNGRAIRRQRLQNQDTIEVGKYKIRFLAEPAAGSFDKTMLVRPAAGVAPPPVAASPGAAAAAPKAVIKVVSGAAAGREVALVKPVTTIGKPGVAVAAISRQAQGYAVAHADGDQPPLLNGQPVGPQPVTMRNGDRLQLAGTDMEFLQV